MLAYLPQLIAAYFVGITCTLTIEGPKEIIYRVSIIDLCGWVIYLLCMEYFHFSTTLSTYFSGLVIAGMSHWFARRYHHPVTVFFIPGFFTLVPGGGMYRTAFYLFDGQMRRGFEELSATLFIALAIALAVFTVDSFVSIMNGQKTLKFIRPTLRRRRKTAGATSQSRERAHQEYIEATKNNWHHFH